MAARWKVDGARGLWLVRGDARAAADLRGEALGREVAAARVDAWFPEGWGREGVGTLAAICHALEGSFPEGEAPRVGWLKGTLRRALRDGRVTAVRVGFGAPLWGVEDGEEEPKTAPRPAVREEKTWIEIVLEDEDDPPQPVAYAKYRIELPDGSVREGILDDRGRARIVGIDPGECQVTFPSFDAEDVRRA